MSGRLEGTDSLFFSAIAFLTATFIFLAIDFLRKRRKVVSTKKEGVGSYLGLLSLLNVLTAITFIGFYSAISLIPAATATAIEVAVSPLAVLFIGILLHSESKTKRDWVFSAGLFIVSMLLAWRESTFTDIGEGSSLVLGVALSLIAGIGASSIAIISKRLGDLNVSAVEVTAHRFHLTYLAAFVLLLLNGASFPSFDDLLPLFFLAATAVVIPLYLLQVGLQKVDSLLAIIIVTTLPSVTYLFQVVLGGYFDLITFTLINITIAVAIFYGVQTLFANRRMVKIGAKDS